MSPLVKCPTCGARARFVSGVSIDISPPILDGTWECENKHQFEAKGFEEDEEDDRGSSNGRTPDFGPGCGGSSPSPRTKEDAQKRFMELADRAGTPPTSMLAVGDDWQKYGSKSRMRRLRIQGMK